MSADPPVAGMRPLGRPGSSWLIALVLTACSTAAVPSATSSDDGSAAQAEVTSTNSVTTTTPEADSTMPGTAMTEAPIEPTVVGPLGWTHSTPPPGVAEVEEMWAMTDGGFALWTGSDIWTSADGMEWTLSATTPDLADVYSVPRSVSDFADGWLVIGEGSEGKPVVAYSADGTTWEATPLAETKTVPLMIAASGSTAVVIGGALSEAGDLVAGVWISHDGRSWRRAPDIYSDPEEGVQPERLVFTGIEFVMQGYGRFSPGKFGVLWRSTDGEVWVPAGYGDMLDLVNGLTALNGEPIVLEVAMLRWGEKSFRFPNTTDIVESEISGWPLALADGVSGEPVGGGLGLIVASAADLWFTADGDTWSSQLIDDVFGSEGEMIGAAVSDVSVLVAFSPNGGEPLEMWLGEPTE